MASMKKHPLRTFGLALWFAASIATAGESSPADSGSEVIQFEPMVVTPTASNSNLLVNSSFEQFEANGIPTGWQWIPYRSDAKCVPDFEISHSGKHGIKVTDSTPQNKDVYGMLHTTQPIKLKPGAPYTLSAWVKTNTPALFNVAAGADWQYRASANDWSGEWRHISKTFTPEPKDCDCIVRILIESPTPGLWIDDVKLEEGDTATADLSAMDNGTAAVLFFDETNWQFRDDKQERMILLPSGPFRLSYMLGLSQDVDGTLDVTLSTGEKYQQPLKVAAGVYRLVLQGATTAARDMPRTLSLHLKSNDKDLAHADTRVRIFSPEHARVRLAALKAELPALKKDIDDLKARGQDVSYPTITYTILENSNNLAVEDSQRSEVDRAFQQIDDMDEMLSRLKQELTEALAGKKEFPQVPRWTGAERPIVKSSSLLGPVRMPDGKVVARPIFFNGVGQAERQIAFDMAKFPNYGMNVVHFEACPTLAYPKEGVADTAYFQKIHDDLDKAEKAGMAVCLLLGPHYMPDWAMAKWPKLKSHSDGWMQYCLHTPEGREFFYPYVKELIAPIANHPALLSICLSNEPISVEEPCDAAREMWKAWLEDRHKTIERLNQRYGSSYASFIDVPLPDPFNKPAEKPLWMDFVRFNQEFLSKWHQMLADVVHEIAPNVPVHCKPIVNMMVTSTAWPSTSTEYGVDATLFGRFSNINGCDALTFSTKGCEFANDWRTAFLGYDLMRSVFDAPVFNSENHIIWDGEKNPIPANHIREILWQEAIHGQSATTIWVWQSCYDQKACQYGNIMYRPACTEAVGVANCDLNRAAYEVTALQQAKPDVLLLQSTTASVWNAQRYDNCMMRLYTALSFTGLKIGFITERQLEDGQTPDARVVLVPDITHLSDAAAASLGKFGGRLVFVGTADDVLALNEYGHPHKERLRGEIIDLAQEATRTDADLRDILQVKLHDWKVRPLVEVHGEDEKPVWGVEWRCVDTPDGTLVNVCNYRSIPLTVSLVSDGRMTSAQDVLTGQTVDGLLELKSLEYRLLRIKSDSAADMKLP